MNPKNVLWHKENHKNMDHTTKLVQMKPVQGLSYAMSTGHKSLLGGKGSYFTDVTPSL
jgi:hypothetical protein